MSHFVSVSMTAYERWSLFRDNAGPFVFLE